MKYIYDILLNFNEELYEFYEWNEDDYYDYIKKIAVIKVTKNMLIDIKYKKIIMDKEFIKSICNTCEVYTKNGTKFNQYACLFTSNSSIIAVEFNYEGISIMKSDLLIDEALDVIEVCKKIKPVNLQYFIVSNDKNELITRYEKNKLFFMKREINNLYKNNNINRLKYIYYECFNKNEENTTEIYNNLINYIRECPDKLYELLMLPYQKC